MKVIKKSQGCCGKGQVCGCQESVHPIISNQLIIDFLYLDLSVCSRCQSTDTSLDEALSEVSHVLKSTGIDVVIHKIQISSEALAIQHRFMSSPTIRLNGEDIQLESRESLCESCGDLCGDEVDCRVWVYKGTEYNAPPKAMIIEAILHKVYGHPSSKVKETPYVLPQNLKKFFAGMTSKDKE